MNDNANIGRMLSGKYEIIRELGVGGMGAVYEGHHQLINRRVAIKLLHAELAKDDVVVKRFQQEARAAAAIGSDHIVGIIDLVVTPEGEHFIVMEYLEGADLGSYILDEVPFPADWSCHVMIQVLLALEAAHKLGIVHRDLKPGNIFLAKKKGRDDFVKLVDFGIAKMIADEIGLTKGLTRSGTLLGTPSYMSPEQARGEKNITGATDIYSAGTILFCLLTGRLPFVGDSYTDVLFSILNLDCPIQALERPDIDPALAKAVLKAMAKEPANRFERARDFLTAILPFSPATLAVSDLHGSGLEPENDPSSIVHSLPEPPCGAARARANRGTVGIGSTDRSRVSPVSDSRTPVADMTVDFKNIAEPSELSVEGSEARPTAKRSDADGNTAPQGMRSSWKTFLPITVVACALVAGLLVWFGWNADPLPATVSVQPLTPDRGSPAPGPTATTQNGPQPTILEPSPARPSATSAENAVQIEIAAHPSFADIMFDGTSVGKGIASFSAQQDGKEHQVSVSADGFFDATRKVTLERDVALEFKLARRGVHIEGDDPGSAAKPRSTQAKPSKKPLSNESAEPSTEPGADKSSEKNPRRYIDDIPW